MLLEVAETAEVLLHLVGLGFAENGETIEVTYYPCNLGRLEIVTLGGGTVHEFGYARSGPWNPLAP